MPMIWTGLGVSVRGAQHVKQGKSNQDAFTLHEPKRAGGSLCLALADGHGSGRSFRSERGAALATACAVRLLRDFARKSGAETPLSGIRRQAEERWPRRLLAEWRRAVRADLVRDPFGPLDFAAFPEAAPNPAEGEELPFASYLAYGATLVALAITRRYAIFAQLGDGDILVVQADGTVSRPWPREHAFHAHETVSLCSGEAVQEFKIRVEPLRGGGPALILLATDGYANCFGDDAGFFQVGRDFLGYLREGGPALVREHLEGWLSDSSRDGSGDDITVGLAVRLSALRGT